MNETLKESEEKVQTFLEAISQPLETGVDVDSTVRKIPDAVRVQALLEILEVLKKHHHEIAENLGLEKQKQLLELLEAESEVE